MDGNNWAEDETVDSWEQQDGGQLDRTLEQRHQQVLKQQQKQAQLEKAKADAMSAPGPVKILRRPQSAGNLQQSVTSAAKSTVPLILPRPKDAQNGQNCKDIDKSKTQVKSFEERERAYAEARMRIFGQNYDPPTEEEENDEETLMVLNNNSNSSSSSQNNPTSDQPVVTTILGPYGRPPAGLLSRVSSSPDQFRPGATDQK